MTTNTSTQQSFLSAAEEIQNLLDSMGFTSDESHDGENTKQLIADIIKKHIETNPNLIDVSELP